MVLKNAFVAIVCSASLALGGVAFADEYQPNQYLGLDLSSAVLSPKRLGPPAQFEPVPVEAKTDQGQDQQASSEPPKVEQPRTAHTAKVTAPVVKKRAAMHMRARAKLARRHSNPLDAEARDIRIQTWPCRSGGICNWQR